MRLFKKTIRSIILIANVFQTGFSNKKLFQLNLRQALEYALET